MLLVEYSNHSIKVEWFGARLSTTLDVSFFFYIIKQSNSVSFRLLSDSEILCLIMKFLLPSGLPSASKFVHLHFTHTRTHAHTISSPPP